MTLFNLPKLATCEIKVCPENDEILLLFPNLNK
jgi:hypothetical protein